MRRAVLGLLLLTALLPAEAPGTFDEVRWDRFMERANAFQRLLKGCPPTGYPPEIECRAALGRFDVRTWRETLEADPFH